MGLETGETPFSISIRAAGAGNVMHFHKVDADRLLAPPLLLSIFQIFPLGNIILVHLKIEIA